VRIGRILLGGLFIAAGFAHFVFTRMYANVVPDYLPAHRALVLISGAAEIAGGASLVFAPTRRAAAFGLAALVVLVFPANIWMAQHPERYPNISQWLLLARLPLQIPLLVWVMRYVRKSVQ
jgi:uncharacterized membrane protein